jgi:hypothetical protein
MDLVQVAIELKLDKKNMKLFKLFLIIGFLFSVSTLSAQFRMVGSGSWSPLTDSTHVGQINFLADLTGEGFLATGISDTMLLFTGTQQQYRVIGLANVTFSSAQLTVVEIDSTTTTGPIGQVMVYENEGRKTIPQVPFGSTGSTAQIQAAIDTWNSKIDEVGGGGAGGGTLQEAIDAELAADGVGSFAVTYPSGVINDDDGSSFNLRFGDIDMEMDGDSMDLSIANGEWFFGSNVADQVKVGVRYTGFGENPVNGLGGDYSDLMPNSLVPKAYVDNNKTIDSWQETINEEITDDPAGDMQVTFSNSGTKIKDDAFRFILNHDAVNTGGDITIVSDSSIFYTLDGTFYWETDQMLEPIGMLYLGFGEDINGDGGDYSTLQANSLAPRAYVDAQAGVKVAYDSLVLGSVLVEVTRLGGTATSLSNPSQGEYVLAVPADTKVESIEIFGDNGDLNGANEMIFRINNSANSKNHRWMVQLYDANNGALVDQQATGTNHVQSISGAITSLTIPGLNGFGATGYFIIIK